MRYRAPATAVPIRLLSLLLTLLLTLLLGAPTAAFADEGEPEDTAAARLFREGWWSETGAGALDKALDSYKQAVAAKGSEAVRARAQYRMALVLQRMGRMEEAVRALEKLAGDFAGQTELLTKARQRLDEWTAEDLRESFGDWYRRYQYSPEFQAKIVDLILELGAPDAKVANAAREELLTIGEPALPALREHATSANVRLRQSVVTLMINLEVLPTPEALFGSSQWERNWGLWQLIAKLSGDARGAYAAFCAAKPDDWRARWITACLRGPEAVVDVLAAQSDSRNYAVNSYLSALLAMKPPPEVYARLRGLVLDPKAAGFIRYQIASQLGSRRDWKSEAPDPTGVTDDVVLQWAACDDAEVRDVAWNYMAGALLRKPGAWRAAAAFLSAATVIRGTLEEEQHALLAQLRRAGSDEDLEPAIAAMTHVLNGGGLTHAGVHALAPPSNNASPGSPDVPRRVLAAAIARSRGQVVSGAAQQWWTAVKRDQDLMATVIGWISSAQDAVVRREAVNIASRELRDGVGRLLQPFQDPQLRHELHEELLKGLQQNQALESLDWDADSLTVLVQLTRERLAVTEKQPGSQGRKQMRLNLAGASTSLMSRLGYSATYVFYRLLRDARLRETMFEAAAAQPEKFTPEIWPMLGNGWSEVEENRRTGIRALQEGWKRWTPDRKAPGLKVFLERTLVGYGDEELEKFVRTILGQGLDAESRAIALRALATVTLADVQAAFDFSDPKTAWTAVTFLGLLPGDEETYDAYKAMLVPDVSRHVADRIYEAFKRGPESRIADLVTRLLAANDDARAEQHAIWILENRKSAKDLHLWRLALVHRDADVRKAAASALGNLYDQDSIKALARAVDDPNPEVRDAALASLARIEKIENDKERWRKFAEGRAPGPGK